MKKKSYIFVEARDSTQMPCHSLSSYSPAIVHECVCTYDTRIWHRQPHRSTYVYTYIHTYKYMDTHKNTHKWRHTHISTYSSQSCQGEAAWLRSHNTSQKEWKRKRQPKSTREEEGEKGPLKCSLTHSSSGARWARMKRPSSRVHKGSQCNSQASLAPTQNKPSQTPDD